MGAAKPCLGYRSRTEACISMRAKGYNNHTIAHNLGISASSVAALISSKKNQRASVQLQRTVCVDNDVLDALRPVAAERGISVNQLCRNLLAQIAEDDLADAVLDDALEVAIGP